MNRRFFDVAIVSLTACLAVASSLFAQPHLDRFSRGFRAMRYELFNEAVWWFDHAREAKPTAGGKPVRLYGRQFTPYMPCYFSGVALFNAGRFTEAKQRWTECRDAWSEASEELGEQVGHYEAMINAYGELIELRGSLLANIDRIYGVGVVESRNDLQQLASESFDSLRSVVQRARLTGDPRFRRRLRALQAKLRSLQADLESRNAAAISPITGQNTFLLASTSLQHRRGASGSHLYLAASQGGRSRNAKLVDYEAHYAVLISPMKYENPSLPPLQGISNSFERLLRSLTRGAASGKPWFEQVVTLPEDRDRGLTRGQLEEWLSSGTLKRWLGPDRNNLVLLVFAGHACNIDGVGLAPLTGSPSCKEAKESKEGFAAMVENSVWVKDIMGLLTPQPRNQGDVVMVFDSCHADLFRDRESCKPWGGGGPPIDTEGRAAIFVAAGRQQDYVEQLALVNALADALDGCGIDRGGTEIVTGYDIFLTIERWLRDQNQYIQKYRCVATADYHLGDFAMWLADRCSRRN